MPTRWRRRSAGACLPPARRAPLGCRPRTFPARRVPSDCPAPSPRGLRPRVFSRCPAPATTPSARVRVRGRSVVGRVPWALPGVGAGRPLRRSLGAETARRLASPPAAWPPLVAAPATTSRRGSRSRSSGRGGFLLSLVGLVGTPSRTPSIQSSAIFFTLLTLFACLPFEARLDVRVLRLGVCGQPTWIGK